MFKRLQYTWKVSAGRLLLIMASFAIGGSLCGYLGRRIMEISGIEKGVLWVILYLLIVTLLWPITVLLVSIPLGQFVFFRQYLRRMGTKLKALVSKQTFSKDENKLL